MEPGSTRGATYSRISEDQAGDEHGVTNQAGANRDFAAGRGIAVDPRHEYSDNDISATYGAPRPGYEAMMRAAAAGEFSAIVIFHTSRLWRNRRERADGIEILKKAGISVLAVKGPSLDMSTAYGRGMAGLIGEFDTMESEIKSERQQLAAKGRAREGKAPLGTRLMGYTAGDDLEPAYLCDVFTRREVSEAEFIGKIFGRFHSGDSLRGIATWWKESGFPTRHGGDPNSSTVRDILTNPRYCGRIYYNRHEDGTAGEWVPATSPAIIDEVIWEAVNATLADPRRRKQQGTDRKHLGAGLYYCPNGHLVRSHGTPVRYRCAAGCVTRSAAPVDEKIVKLTRARLAWADVASLVTATAGKEATAAAAGIRALRGRLEQTNQDYDNDLIDARRHKEKTAKISAELDQAETRRARLLAGSEVAGILTAPGPVAAFDGAPLGVRQAVIRFFMTVELLPAPRGRKGFDPETIRITPNHPAETSLQAADPRHARSESLPDRDIARMVCATCARIRRLTA